MLHVLQCHFVLTLLVGYLYLRFPSVRIPNLLLVLL